MEEVKALVLADWEKPEVLQGRIKRMLEIQQHVMKRGVDYDIIPGCKKPSLMKPGGELLMVTFKLSDTVEITKEIDEEKNISYEVKTSINSQQGGVYLGCGVGCASTGEEKYKWRKAVCPEEYSDTEDHLKRTKWFKADNWKPKPYRVMQIRTNPLDVANTVLKMAKKRSKLDGVMSTTAASRIYTQDVAEMSKELQDILLDENQAPSSKPMPSKPTTVKKSTVSKSGTERAMPTEEERKKHGFVSEKQGWFILGKLKNNNIEEEKFLAIMGKRSIFYLFKRKDILDKIIDKIDNDPGYFKDEPKTQKDPPQEVTKPDTVVNALGTFKTIPVPVVMDQKQFISEALDLAAKANIRTEKDVNDCLNDLLGLPDVKSITTVPANQQESVLDFIKSLNKE